MTTAVAAQLREFLLDLLLYPRPFSLPYSPECVEGVFSEVELPFYGVLRSSA